MSDTPTRRARASGRWSPSRPTWTCRPPGWATARTRPGPSRRASAPGTSRTGSTPAAWSTSRSWSSIAAAVTYGFVTLMFNYFEPGTPERMAGPTRRRPAARAARPYNERVADDQLAGPERRGQAAPAGVDADGRDAKPRTSRSTTGRCGPRTRGTRPEIRPEDLRPENFVDWNTGEKPLVDYKWVDQGKGVARIPVSEAIKILARRRSCRPSRGTRSARRASTPRLSNGGAGPRPPRGRPRRRTTRTTTKDERRSRSRRRTARRTSRSDPALVAAPRRHGLRSLSEE